MVILYALRMVLWFGYFFGYLVVHLPILCKGERALREGDTALVHQITEQHVTHWCKVLLKIGGLRVEITGRENIPADRACVFVANHRSYFDIPIMLTSLDAPHGILAKQEIDKIPLVRRWMRLLGCVFVVRDNMVASMKALNAATDTVKNAQSFVVFPEGTRYKGAEGGIGEFKGGAFRTATKTGAPIVPVVLHGTRLIFEDQHYIIRPGTIRVEILPPIETKGMSKDAQKTLPADVQARIAAHL